MVDALGQAPVVAVVLPQCRNLMYSKTGVVYNLDGLIRANRFADSRASLDSRESFQGSLTEPLFCESRFGGLKIANRRFEAIRANRSHVMKIGVFCESIRTNRFTRIAPICVANRRAI